MTYGLLLYNMLIDAYSSKQYEALFFLDTE